MVTLIVALAALVAIALLPSGAAANTPPPGPCEDGYVAPTPTTVSVTSMPITVNSTTADYFVLYARSGSTHYTTKGLPILVKRGEDGTTTLADNLDPLPATRYRLEKYSVAQPGDLDGDCVDDITELSDLGTYNPINSGKKIAFSNGVVSIDSRETFRDLSFKGDTGVRGLEYLDGLEFVKFAIRDFDSDTPATYFINSSTHKIHANFDAAIGISVSKPTDIGNGTIVYHPNIVALDGSLGVYAFRLSPWGIAGISTVEKYYELLAAGMPFVSNDKLYYHPFTTSQVNLYAQEKAQYDSSRVNVLLDEDVLPDVSFIPHNQGEGYGRLRLMEDDERPSPFDVAIYKSLPNDLPRVAGTITTVPQTPLSHVNLRAIQNGLPNAFIRDVLEDSTIKSLIGSYVYFAVGADGYTIRAATKADVDAHFAAIRPQQTQILQRDLTVTSIASLANVSFADWNAYGVKAANVAELTKLSLPTGTTPVGYAVPFYFYDEFMKQATLGEATILGKKKAPAAEKITLTAETTLAQAVTAMLAHSYFQSDADIQEEMLDDLRKAIKNATSPQWVITALTALHANYPDGQSLRYRSSTNNEDLPSFNGAGLYDSKTQDPDETTADGIDKSIKAVWASLWNYRAFLERDFHRVDHTTVAMGVLVHPNYSDELVNGVAVSYDPITFQANTHYINSQVGEDLVTNPEAYSQPEQLLLAASGAATVLSRSTLAKSDKLLMSAAQMKQLRSNLDTIHTRFRTLYQVQDGADFAIEIEFKITAANTLAIKQARPWIFPEPLVLPDPAVSIALGAAQVAEDDELDLTVTRSGGILSTPVMVDLAWSETGAMLQGSKPASVTIPGNQTSATVAVPIVDDKNDEHDSVVTVSVSARSGYTVGTSGSASATITDNDQTKIRVHADAGKVTEGSSVGFTFTRSGTVLEQPLTVSVTVTESGSRLQGVAPTAVTFAANNASATISLPTLNDSVRTAESVVQVQIGAGSDYDVHGAGKASTTIEDDELPPPTLLFDFNFAVPDGAGYVLTTSARGVRGNLSMSVSGPDARHFRDYTFARMIVMDTQQYDDPIDANKDGVYEIDLTASSSLGGTTTERLRFTVVNGELRALAQQQWDQLSEDQRATLLPEVDSDQLEPAFASLTDDVRASVLRLSRQQQLPSPGPTISIAAGAGVTEGSDATFTITATPPPAAPLSVSVTVSQSGDFAASTVQQTVTIPTAGSYTLTVPTIGDNTDEPDGSVTATVDQGTGYVVSWTAGAATVAVSDDDDPSATAPEISIAAGSGVTEGSAATFTITASPSPAADLDVTVTVSQSGDYAATGSQTVTIPTSGTYTLTVATTNDNADEPDGSLTATVSDGTGYTVSSSNGAATVAVADDDVPEISIAAGSGVTEGGDATFTITASPPPAADLDVTIEVTQSGNFASTGSQTVTIPTSGTYTLTVATTIDSTDEPDGSVTATIDTGTGYTVSTSNGAATVAVADDDDPPPATPEISIAAGSGVTEGVDATFTVTASPTPAANLDVTIEVTQSGNFASTGSQTVTIPTSGTYTLTVATTNDSADEPDGSVTATVSDGTGYTVSTSNGAATVAVADDDDPPPATPEISITAGSGVTEGGAATFTVTATPAPAANLDVTIEVTQSGDYALTGSRTVTIPTSGTYTLTVATTDDSADEPDGSVTATVGDGTGYTVSTSNGAATVAVSDDDASGEGQVRSREIIDACVSDSLLQLVRRYYDANKDRTPSYGRNWKRVLIAFADVEDSQLTPYTATEALAGEQQWFGWKPVREALECIEEAPAPPPPATPEISIAAGSGVTEGSAATFTLTATPPPTANLDVTIEVTQSGDYASTGSRTVTISTTGSATFTVATTNDGADEPDGSVTATVDTGTGYTVSTSNGAATVAVADDDVPEISIAAGSGVTEGGAATFTITASPPPTADLDVTVEVSQSGNYASTGSRTVTIPTTGSATLTVATTNDSADEPDGSVTATVSDGTGYTVSTSNGAATVAVADDDDPPPATPEISIAAGAGVTEGGAATFTITASPTPAADLDVTIEVSQSGDYASTGSQTVTIPTSGTYTLTVATTNDSADEPDGSVTATIDTGTGYTVSTSNGAATVAVSDDDASGEGQVRSREIIDACVSDSLLQLVRRYYDANKDRTPNYGRNWKRVLIAFADEEDSQLTPYTATEALAGEQQWFGWKPVREALECIEEAPAPPPPATPEISIAAGSGVTEGSDATFTLTATPPPTANLDVTIEVTQSGNFASIGSQTVTIPTSGTYTLTVATTNDSTDEPDGSVTATIDTGTGYTVSTSNGAATVAVADDDDPPPATPEISIAAGAGVTEGVAATFTITATPAPAAGLDVTIEVTQSGDYASTGSRTVTIPTSGTYTLTVTTTDDSADEPDGSVTATVGDGTGYTVSTSNGAATVAVSDDDASGEGQVRSREIIDACVSDSLLQLVRRYYDANKDRTPSYGRNWKRVLIAFADVEDSQLTPYTATEALAGEQQWFGWKPVREALECIEEAPAPPPPATPEISISAGSGVTEGSAATFTVTATPAPAANLDVTIEVTQSGDYASTGSRTVTIPTSGTYTLTVATTNDSTDEPDGSVTATVSDGTGYTVSSSSGAATVAVADDDDPPPATPEISIAAGSGITEGGDATFTITASPPPAADLDVTIEVTQSGDYASTGSQTVTIPTSGTYTLTVTTTNDSADEPDGSVTATIDTGTGYTVSTSNGAATVAVADDDVPEISIAAGSGITEGGTATFTITASPPPAADLDVTIEVTQSGNFASTGSRTVTISTTGSATFTVATTNDSADEPDGSVTATVDTGTGYTVSSSNGAATVAVADDDPRGSSGRPTVSVADASASEGSQGLRFVVTLSHAHSQAITFRYGGFGRTAASGQDFTLEYKAFTLAAGATSLDIVVPVIDDNTVEGDETLTVYVYAPSGITIPGYFVYADGTITDDD